MSEKLLISLKRGCDCDPPRDVRSPSFRWAHTDLENGTIKDDFYMVEFPSCRKCGKEFIEVTTRTEAGNGGEK